MNNEYNKLFKSMRIGQIAAIDKSFQKQFENVNFLVSRPVSAIQKIIDNQKHLYSSIGIGSVSSMHNTIIKQTGVIRSLNWGYDLSAF